MRTKRTILLAVLLTLALSFSLSGCFLFNDTATKVELTQTPKTQYVVGEDLSNVTFALSVTEKGKDAVSVSFKVGDQNENGVYTVSGVKVKLENFSTSTAGHFKATLDVNDGEATCSFEYDVSAAQNDSGFAGGTGTVNDPYQIATAEQFANIVLKGDQSKYTYYKLIADIDFSSVDFNTLKNADGKTYNQLIDCGYALYPRVPLYSFNGSLDGAAGDSNFKLKNFTATTDNISLFGNIANGSFTNIDVSGFNTVCHRAGAFGSNAYYKADGSEGASVSFKNVNILSNCKLSFGGYLAQVKMAQSATFENCEMAGAVISDGDNVGGFVGATTSCASATFKNCTLSGSVIGFNYVGGFIGYRGTGSGHVAYKASLTDCTITASASITAYGDPTAASKHIKSWGFTFIDEYDDNTNNSNLSINGCTNNGTLTVKSNKVYGNNLPITVGNGKVTVNKAPSTTGGYYRVIYLGNVNHYGFNQTSNKYEFVFDGGYMTPIWKSEKLYNNDSVGYYTEALSYAPSKSAIDFTKPTSYNGADDSQYVTESKTAEGKLVYQGYNEDAPETLLLYKKSLALYVFEYNANGEVIAMAKNA